MGAAARSFYRPDAVKLLQNIYYHMFLDLFFAKIITRFAPVRPANFI